MKTQNDSLNLKGFKFLVVVLTFTLLVLSFRWSVWAQSFCEETIHSKCCGRDSCFGGDYGPQDCPGDQLCCGTCEKPKEEGIINPVIGLFGTQPGELTIGYLLAVFIKMAYAIGAILVLIYFIWGSIEWLTSGGEPESLKKAQSRITNALIGLALLAGTYLVAVILSKILNLEILKIILPGAIK